MTKPFNSAIDAVGSAVSSVATFATHAIAPLQSALTRSVTPSGSGADRSPHLPGADPTVSQPAKLPSSKPSSRGIQSSFLSGVAGGAGATGLGGASGFAQGGKSLLGQ